jgi:hypothetical protein
MLVGKEIDRLRRPRLGSNNQKVAKDSLGEECKIPIQLGARQIEELESVHF